jgi:hypothetical protein
VHRDSKARWLGVLAMAGLSFFFATALALQVLRADYDWITTPLSFYLLGPDSPWLVAAYFALAAAILAVAVGTYSALESPARSALPLLLFAIGAASVCIVALAHTDTVPGMPPTPHGLLHDLTAALAFLCVSVAMLLQSWRFRLDSRFRSYFPRAFPLAVMAFAALLVYALWGALPRGAAQKFVILLIVLWLMLAARWLTRLRSANA